MLSRTAFFLPVAPYSTSCEGRRDPHKETSATIIFTSKTVSLSLNTEANVPDLISDVCVCEKTKQKPSSPALTLLLFLLKGIYGMSTYLG